MTAELLFELRDLWVGVFWDRRLDDDSLVQHIYAGIPFLVFHVSWPLGKYQGQELPKPRRLWGLERATQHNRMAFARDIGWSRDLDRWYNEGGR